MITPTAKVWFIITMFFLAVPPYSVVSIICGLIGFWFTMHELYPKIACPK